jgi:hypothetical protein
MLKVSNLSGCDFADVVVCVFGRVVAAQPVSHLLTLPSLNLSVTPQ